MTMHWCTNYDTDGDPIGSLCECEIGDDHDATGEPTAVFATARPWAPDSDEREEEAPTA